MQEKIKRARKEKEEEEKKTIAMMMKGVKDGNGVEIPPGSYQGPQEYKFGPTPFPSMRKTVLRSRRQPIFDEEKYEEGVCVPSKDLFVNRSSFRDGTWKSDINCNMPSDGMLGVPLEYDLIHLDVTFIGSELAPKDIIYIAQNLKLMWIFGGSMVYLESPISEGERIESDGGIIFRFDMTNARKQARKIFSNESFRAVLSTSECFYHDFRVRVTMKGMLYTPI
jgi:hypothetical protein